MSVLFRDIETRSPLNLKIVGAHRYATDPTTEVLCIGYAVDDGPAEIWIPGQPIPARFIEAEQDPSWQIVAHNDMFERVIEEHILGLRFAWPLVPLERHRCTMAMALAAALPGKLEKVAEALQLAHRKDVEGERLMKRMAQPRRAQRGEDPNVLHWIDDPVSLARLCAYCKQDVEVERELYHRLPPLSPTEQKLWELDARINARGFYTDGALLDTAHRVVTEAEAARQSEFRELTGLDSTNQTAKLIAWLGERDCVVTDVQKGTLKHALRRKGLTPEVRRAIELRLELAHASAAKVLALLNWRGADGRVRGTLGFHVAATGRWAGRGPQPQNFKRDTEGIAGKIAAILAGGAGLESPVEAAGDIARSMKSLPLGIGSWSRIFPASRAED
jgi:DNA polymerase